MVEKTVNWQSFIEQEESQQFFKNFLRSPVSLSVINLSIHELWNLCAIKINKWLFSFIFEI